MSNLFYDQYFDDPSHFDHSGEIEKIETHISLIYLTGDIVYKVKKAVKMGGILDFRELHDRQAYCHREVELNSRFSPDLYLGVVCLSPEGITSDLDDQYEYAVKMRQLPQSSLMRAKIKGPGTIPADLIDQLVDVLVDFYQKTSRHPHAGSIETITKKINENFDTLTSLGWEFEEYQKKIYTFLEDHEEMFQRRQEKGRIVDGHGDLRPKNIFIHEGKVMIFDCIEFNDLLRYVDIAEDIGFLLMEMDHYQQPQRVERMIRLFEQKMDDPDLRTILPFYMSYRAAVRVKVKLFRISELDEIADKDEIQELKAVAKEYGNLARSYTERM